MVLAMLVMASCRVGGIFFEPRTRDMDGTSFLKTDADDDVSQEEKEKIEEANDAVVSASERIARNRVVEKKKDAEIAALKKERAAAEDAMIAEAKKATDVALTTTDADAAQRALVAMEQKEKHIAAIDKKIKKLNEDEEKLHERAERSIQKKMEDALESLESVQK